MKILLLSAYDATSHQYWRKALVKNFPECDWNVLPLPARFFSWRVRGNSLSYAFEHQDTLNQDYDLVISTSMTDLAALRGMHPKLSSFPTLVYFHENQFAYPRTSKAFKSIEPQIVNFYTALCGDLVCFNSEFNKSSFMEGVEDLLKKLPDHAPVSSLGQLKARSMVLPVPLESTLKSNGQKQNRKTSDLLQIVWNHRWEYDKGPELLFEGVRQLKERTADFKLHVVGQQFRNRPEIFDQLKALLGSNLGHWGYLEKDEYQQLLETSDVVLSTAKHDFQGIAVLEAVAAGCLPLVPDRLAYPELFPEQFRYQDSSKSGSEYNAKAEGSSIAQQLASYIKQKHTHSLPFPPDLKNLCWSHQREAYRAAFEQATSTFQHNKEST